MSPLRTVLVVLCCLHSVWTSCPDVDRAGWGANPPRISPQRLKAAAPFVVIHHTYIPSECNDTETCTGAMRTMQHMHQIVNGWNDIGYNFAIGSEGTVYEGRGWDVVGAHAPKYNFMSVGICFIGDYRTVLPPAAMMKAAHELIRCGVERGSILSNYTLVGHRQVRDTECPGGALFREIQGWPHWKDVHDIQPRVTTTTSTTIAAPSTDDVADPAEPKSEKNVEVSTTSTSTSSTAIPSADDAADPSEPRREENVVVSTSSNALPSVDDVADPGEPRREENVMVSTTSNAAPSVDDVADPAEPKSEENVVMSNTSISTSSTAAPSADDASNPSEPRREENVVVSTSSNAVPSVDDVADPAEPKSEENVVVPSKAE